MMEASFTLLEPNIERFLSYTHLLRLFYRYIEHLYDEFNLEQLRQKVWEIDIFLNLQNI